MKSFIYILFFSFLFSNPSVSEIRELYKEAANSREITQQLYAKLKGVKKTDNAVLVAYKGASLILIAKNSKEKKNKKANFKKGIELLEYSIARNPKNIELRFIRLTIQERAPKFLKYKNNISEDTSLINDQLKSVKNSNLQACIQEYVLQSNLFTIEEKNVISKL